jgi:hypothetical protein
MSVRMLGIQVWHMNDTILPMIPSTQMGTNSMLCNFGIGIIAVVQDHELDVTEDRFNRVVIGAAFGQADPMEVQLTHDLASEPRLARMGTVLVQDDPHGNIRIPFAEVM